jgi:ubiquinone/menaquinone biosynthesis C-methylase UbiE
MLASRIERLCGGCPHSILDAGVGPGFLTLECWYKFHARIQCIDINPEMLQLTRQLLRDEGVHDAAISLQEADIHAMPFPDRSFDLVMSYSCFHHWRHPRQGLEECIRVLKEGGLLFVVDTAREASAVGRAFGAKIGEPRFAQFVAEAFQESWSVRDVEILAETLPLPAAVEPFAFDELDVLGAMDRLHSFPVTDTQPDLGPVAWQLVGRRESV